jgi:D-apionolactonase
MEDQRNWSDASFKTYPRPHAWPKPYLLKAGEEVSHSIEICFEPPLTANRILPPSAAPATFQVTLPKIGVMASTEPFEDLSAIQSIGFHHVGVLIDSDNHDWRDDLAQQLDVADAIGAPVQLFIRGELPTHLPAELAPIEVVLGDVGTRPWSMERVQEVANRFPGIPIVAASPDNFTELNRDHVASTGLTGYGFGVNPQVHAFDDRSIFEATETLSTLTENCRGLGLPWVSIGPITFEPRHWSTRTPDPRLSTPFHTAWWLRCILHFSIAGADRVTIGFSHGPRGATANADLLNLLSSIMTERRAQSEIRLGRLPLEPQSLSIGNQKWTVIFDDMLSHVVSESW